MVLVTGASRGIGAATARWLAGAGANLVLVARDGDGLRQVATDACAVGVDAQVVAVDLVQAGAPQQVVESAVGRFGRLDALINNAAIATPLQRLSSADPSAWRRTFELNVMVPAALQAAALPALRRARGRVVNVCSELAESPRHGMGAYCSSKAALLQMTRVLDLEEPEIVAVAYAPGVTDTTMMALLRADAEGALAPAMVERLRGMHAGGTMGDPVERARTLAWLALHAPAELGGRLIDHTDPSADRAARAALGSAPGTRHASESARE